MFGMPTFKIIQNRKIQNKHGRRGTPSGNGTNGTNKTDATNQTKRVLQYISSQRIHENIPIP